MGLAASQARLLTITARKADCEFQSMNLSHQKIALSRDMERISDEYQNATSKTKLVYDYYGSGTSQTNLNYGLLMTPSAYNDYLPKLITDTQNRVVLSLEYANAARFAGIPQEGYSGTPSSEIRNLFIEGLMKSNIIAPITATNIENTVYNDGIGLGSLVQANEAYTTITYDELIKQLKNECPSSEDYGLYLGHIPQNMPEVADVTLSTCVNDGTGVELYAYTKDGLDITTDGNKELNISDLLNTDADATHYVYSFQTGLGAMTPLTEAAIAQQAIVGSANSISFLNWLSDSFASVLGGTTENDAALQYAYDAIVGLLYPNEKVQDIAQKWRNDDQRPEDNVYGAKSHYYNDNRDHNKELLDEIGTRVDRCEIDKRSVLAYSNNKVQDEAKSYIGFTYSYTDATHNAFSYSTIAIDLNNLTQVYLTAYMEYLNGETYDYNKGKMSESTLYTPKGTDEFKIGAIDVDSNGEEDLTAGFYDAMFNIICTNGWTENENINNTEYMQELLKNGAIYLSEMDNDAYYYQTSYKTNTYITEVADSDAVAQAEAKYNAEKARIENKENTIDMKMKNLDTEITSLTTEYDTMKSLISKTVEKSFKRYDA